MILFLENTPKHVKKVEHYKLPLKKIKNVHAPPAPHSKKNE